MKSCTLFIYLLIIGLVVIILFNLPKREGYRDPLYLNRAKLAYDWYPRSNGSIYGFPYRYGGSWTIFSGYPYYDKAY